MPIAHCINLFHPGLKLVEKELSKQGFGGGGGSSGGGGVAPEQPRSSFPGYPSVPGFGSGGMASSATDGLSNILRGGGGSSGKCKSFKGQDYDSIKRECRGRLFEDPAFPASNRLLVDDNSNYVISYFGRTRFDAGSIEWLRPNVSSRST